MYNYRPNSLKIALPNGRDVVLRIKKTFDLSEALSNFSKTSAYDIQSILQRRFLIYLYQSQNPFYCTVITLHFEIKVFDWLVGWLGGYLGYIGSFRQYFSQYLAVSQKGKEEKR